MTEVCWENLRPRQMEARVNACSVVYLPFGSLEWHGYHNPLGLDTIKARALCLRAAQAGGGILAPATFWPIGGLPHPWTVRMPPALIHSLATAIFEQMAHVEFRVAIALTGHYGVDQVLQLKKAALDVMNRSGLTAYALPEFELAVDAGYRGDHAAKWETSLTQALFPELVDMAEAEREGQPMDGVGGEDPRVHASAELGARTVDLIATRLVTVAHRLVRDTSLRERSRFIEATTGQCRVLEAYGRAAYSAEAYWQGVMAIWEGRYQDAIQTFVEVDKQKGGVDPTRRTPDGAVIGWGSPTSRMGGES